MDIFACLVYLTLLKSHQGIINFDVNTHVDFAPNITVLYLLSLVILFDSFKYPNGVTNFKVYVTGYCPRFWVEFVNWHFWKSILVIGQLNCLIIIALDNFL